MGRERRRRVCSHLLSTRWKVEPRTSVCGRRPRSKRCTSRVGRPGGDHPLIAWRERRSPRQIRCPHAPQNPNNNLCENTMASPGLDPVGEVLASMRRDLNCLTDSDRAIRKRGLTRVHQRYETRMSRLRLRLRRDPGNAFALLRRPPLSCSSGPSRSFGPRPSRPRRAPWLTARRATAAPPLRIITVGHV